MGGLQRGSITITVLAAVFIIILAQAKGQKEYRMRPKVPAGKGPMQVFGPRIDHGNMTMGASLNRRAVQAKPTRAVAMHNVISAPTAPPSNDNFSNAQLIIGTSSSVTGTNVGASKQLGEPNHAGDAGGASVWYRWQPTSNGAAAFATTGSSFDTLLAVYTGSSVGNLTLIAENDDADSSTLQSALSFDAQAGIVYYIAVDGFAGDTGSIVLGWGLNSPIFNSRFVLQVGSDGRFNMGAFPDPSGGGGPNSWDLMYRWPDHPYTSFSTLRIDGVDNVYGSSGVQIEGPNDIDGATSRSKWKIDDIEVTQTLEIVFNPQTNQNDVAKISYVARNTGSISHQTGLRVMIDSEVNYNDGVPFRVPSIGIVNTEREFTGASVPDTFQGFFDVTDSNHVAVSTLKSGGATAPDRLVLASWPEIKNTAYDYVITPNLDFTADSAYALYWNPASLAPGASRTYVTFYGLSQLDVNLQPPLALGVTAPATLSIVNGQYSPNPFDVVATVFNNGNATATNVRLALNLPAGLSLAAGAASQDLGSLAVGQEKQASWKVTAAPQSSQTTLTYSVDATASNAQTKTVQRQISLAAIQKAPLIFIPGIAGSKLDNSLINLWPSPVFLLGNLSGLSLDPRQIQLQVRAPDVIRHSALAGDVYGPLLERLVGSEVGYKEYPLDPSHPEWLTTNGCNKSQSGTPSLFVFPYDWRKSNQDNANSLQDYIGCVKQFYPAGTKIDVLTHSMGGLVARRYMIRNPSSHQIGRLITVAAPWLGAPKAIDVLETGRFVDNFFAQLVSSGAFKELSEFYGGVHELLPSRKYFVDMGQRPLYFDKSFFRAPQLVDNYADFVSIIDNRFRSDPGTTGAAFHDEVGQDDGRVAPTNLQQYHLYGMRPDPDTIKTVEVPPFCLPICAVVSGVLTCTTRCFSSLTFAEGDGTVPEISATRGYVSPTSAGLNASGATVCKYTGVADGVSHTGLMNPAKNNEVFEDIKTILSSASQLTCTALQSGSPISSAIATPSTSAYYVKIIGSGSVIVGDGNGHTTNPLSDPPDAGLPGVSTFIIGPKASEVILPSSTSFTLTLRADSGPMAIIIARGNEQPDLAVKYQDLSLPVGVFAIIRFTQQGVENLAYDADGNGTFETVINPTISTTGSLAADNTPPDISLVPTTQGNALNISLNATDIGVGVRTVQYSLDGAHFQTYTGPFAVNPLTGPAVYAYAEDFAYNRSRQLGYFPTFSGNEIDNAQFFVRQHYLDFLNRGPDQPGLDYWTGQITQCGANQACINNKRIDVSNAFFYELEYQQTGSYVYRLYRAAYGNNQPFSNPDSSNLAEAHKLPSYAAFAPDRAQVVGGSGLAQSQLAFANAFVQRTDFVSKYSASLDGPGFVDAVLATIKSDIGVDLVSQRQQLIDLYNQSGRGAVMYRLSDDNLQTNPINNRPFIDSEYNRAFVFTQYAGYLGRNADIGGFLFWLGQVNRFPIRNGNAQHAMVCSFITSVEYQKRFGSVVTHTNAECPQ